MRPEQGWYPDPTNSQQLRWWDGNGWTAQTRSAEGSAQVQPPVQPEVQSLSEPPGGQAQDAAASAAPAGPDLTKAAASAAPPAGQAPSDPASGFQQPAYQQPGYEQHGAGQPAYPSYGQSGTYSGPPQAGSPYPGAAMLPAGGNYPLAGQGLRLVARILDTLLVSVIVGILLIPFYGGYVEAIEAAQNNPEDPMALYTTGYWAFSGASWAFTLIIWLAYEGVMLRKKGATLGKMALKLRVESESGAAQLTWGQAMGRVLMYNLPNLVTCGLWGLINPLWCLWDRKRQCLHDKPVHTRVVTTEQH